MTSLRKLDVRLLNVNVGLTTANSVGGMSPSSSTRPRYNTPTLTKLIDTSDHKLLTPDVARKKLPRSNEYWDADVQSYMYLHEFISANPEWMQNLQDIAKKEKPSQQMDRDRLRSEIGTILDLAPEREERFLEIIDQDNGDGALNYWLGMLQVNPARHPATYLMIRVGRRIGEHVVMCLKGFFGSPRPSQVCPAIVPMIDPPGTPSFPAGHAVQAYLISYLLAYSLPKIPQQYRGNGHDNEKKDLSDEDFDKYLGTEKGVLFDLAERVSINRVVAGVHFMTDIIAGKEVGKECFRLLTKAPSTWSLQPLPVKRENCACLSPSFASSLPGGSEGKRFRKLVQEEFPQYV
jgi:hypothetical protein